MGRKITQRIYVCSLCGKIPDDGEHLWEMCGEYWCKDCAEKEEPEEGERRCSDGKSK